MKKITFLVKSIFVLSFFIGTASMEGQVEFKLQTEMGSRFNDVNSNGTGISGTNYYDFETNTMTPIEPEALKADVINDNGDVGGVMYLDEAEGTTQPAHREDGVWKPIGWLPDADPAESTFTTYGISPNGKYVAGQMSKGALDFGTFLYDTETEELFDVFDPSAEAITAYTVANDGTVAGWWDEVDGGTVRIPAYFNKDIEVNTLPDGQTITPGQVVGINANNVMVGDFDGQPFIYDQPNDTFTSFDAPQGNSATFTGISDNGVAVGYEDTAFQVREAIIYHPDIDENPVYLKDVLADFGVEIGTIDGMLGTAIAISSDGNYVAGWVNGPPPFAEGWMVYFDDLLLQESACNIDCPDDIEVTSEFGETSQTVNYEVTFTCDGETPPGTELVLVNGLASGSEFPLGTTTIFYQLQDGDGNILDSCSFDVTVNDFYCVTEYDTAVEPITNVLFAGIDNTTTADPTQTQANEYFLDITGEVEQGETYPISLQGYTGGPYTNTFSVFIDWDQDGTFNTDDEMYDGGSITESTGDDGQEANSEIIVPQEATLGITRMRIVKNFGSAAAGPCESLSYGQTEDYLLNVEEGLGINNENKLSISLYPNPVKNTLNISSNSKIETISIYSVTGQQIKSIELDGTKGIDVSSLATGIYFVKAFGINTSTTFKIIKN